MTTGLNSEIYSLFIALCSWVNLLGFFAQCKRLKPFFLADKTTSLSTKHFLQATCSFFVTENSVILYLFIFGFTKKTSFIDQTPGFSVKG
jgi:hypothetical protein